MNRDDSYERIAHWYDVDMARNMPFDDVAFYLGVSANKGGRVLELGCGNGRILLELLARGIDAFIPRLATTAGEFREDYRRACGGHTLVRSKRIRVLGPRLNCIERRYRLLSTQGELLEQVDTTEHIQTFTPQELEATVAGAGF